MWRALKRGTGYRSAPLSLTLPGRHAGRRGNRTVDVDGGGATGPRAWRALKCEMKDAGRGQWWNRRMPVNAMAMPYRSHAAITSASRTEPPGSAT